MKRALALLLTVWAGIGAVWAQSNLVGTLAPSHILPTFQGNQYLDLAKLYYPGQEKPREPRSVVVLNFMSLACAPCRRELPVFRDLLRAAIERTKSSGVPIRCFVVSLDPLSQKEKLRQYLVEQGLDLDAEVLLDPYRMAAKKFGLLNGAKDVIIPRTIAISPYGRITADIVGFCENTADSAKNAKAIAEYKRTLLKGIVAARQDKGDP